MLPKTETSRFWSYGICPPSVEAECSFRTVIITDRSVAGSVILIPTIRRAWPLPCFPPRHEVKQRLHEVVQCQQRQRRRRVGGVPAHRAEAAPVPARELPRASTHRVQCGTRSQPELPAVCTRRILFFGALLFVQYIFNIRTSQYIFIHVTRTRQQSRGIYGTPGCAKESVCLPPGAFDGGMPLSRGVPGLLGATCPWAPWSRASEARRSVMQPRPSTLPPSVTQLRSAPRHTMRTQLLT